MTIHAKKIGYHDTSITTKPLNDAILEFFRSVTKKKFDDDGQTARFRRKHIDTVVAIIVP